MIAEIRANYKCFARIFSAKVTAVIRRYIMKKQNALVVLASLAAGIAAGTVNGLVGAGGGIVIYYAVTMLKRPKSENVARRLVTSLSVCLPMSFVSAVILHKSVDAKEALIIFTLIGAIGGICGAKLSGKLPQAVLRAVFAAILFIGGIKMLM